MLKFVEKIINLPPLCLENLSLVVYFDSFTPISYKHGLVNTLIFRCFKICPSYEKLHYEIVYLKGIFKRNIYPHDFVDPCIKRFFDKLYIPPKKLSDG